MEKSQAQWSMFLPRLDLKFIDIQVVAAFFLGEQARSPPGRCCEVEVLRKSYRVADLREAATEQVSKASPSGSLHLILLHILMTQMLLGISFERSMHNSLLQEAYFPDLPRILLLNKYHSLFLFPFFISISSV
jgi:hypothetical protein